MFKLSSYNCKNFKTNHHMVSKLISDSNITFLCKHWLNLEEKNLLVTAYPNKKLIFHSDMSISNPRPGRQFGGWAWLLDKEIEIENSKTFNKHVHVLQVKYMNVKIIFLGVWLPYFNGLESEIGYDSCLALNQSKADFTFVLGDFNADLTRNNLIDDKMRLFIEDNELNSINFLFNKFKQYTYRNGRYTSTIDYILADDSCLDVIKNFEVIFDRSDLSDHRPIKCLIDFSNETASNSTHNQKNKFHHFPWYNKDFCATYLNKFE
jgi:hypothetical protein